MSSGISFSGLSSGIDTDSIISKLISLQKRPINKLKAQQIVLDKKTEALNGIKSKLSDLLSKIKSLLTIATFNATQISSSDTTLLKATSTSAAAIGTHNAIVKQLATSSTLTSSTFVGTSIDPAAALASTTFKTVPVGGTFTIAHDTGSGLVTKTFTFDPNSESLNDIINMINTDADLGAPANGIVASYDAATDTFKLKNKNGVDSNPILLGSGSDTSNFFTATNLFTGTVTAGPPYSVKSSIHMAGVRSNSVITGSGANFGTTVTAGTFSINGVYITIDGTADTLNSVIDKINASSAGVTAAYDATADKITLTSKALGNTSITVADGTSNFASAAKLTTATQSTGNQAIVNVDGTDYFRNTNAPTDIINGISLELVKADPATTVTLTVSKNISTAKSAIEAFVNSFNAVETAIFDATKPAQFDGTTVTKAAGTLAGDSIVRGINFTLENFTTSGVTGLAGLDSLADIGITLTRNEGSAMQLSIDSAKLDEALQTNTSQVAQLFLADISSPTTTKGIAVQLDEYLEPETEDDGSIATLVSGNTDLKKTIDTRIKTLEERLQREEDRLKSQFAALEVALSKLQQQGSALSSNLGMLSALTSTRASSGGI